MKALTRIIGIDPGSRITGYGILDTDGFRHAYVTSGYISIKGDELAQRLGSVFQQISQVIEEWKPQSAGSKAACPLCPVVCVSNCLSQTTSAPIR